MPRLYPMEVDVLLQEDTNKERYRQVKVSREGVSTSEKNVVVVSWIMSQDIRKYVLRR